MIVFKSHPLTIDAIDDTMMTIHFNADLRPIVGERVGMLHWSMDPQVSGFIIGYDLGGNQVLICNFDVSKSSSEPLDDLIPDDMIVSALSSAIMG